MIVARTSSPPMEVHYFEVTDPEELARIRERDDRSRLNLACWKANAKVIDEQHRGMHVCFAGGEFFVAEDPLEAERLGRAAHPNDDARLVIYVPKEKSVRIYAL